MSTTLTPAGCWYYCRFWNLCVKHLLCKNISHWNIFMNWKARQYFFNAFTAKISQLTIYTTVYPWLVDSLHQQYPSVQPVECIIQIQLVVSSHLQDLPKLRLMVCHERCEEGRIMSLVHKVAYSFKQLSSMQQCAALRICHSQWKEPQKLFYHRQRSSELVCFRFNTCIVTVQVMLALS